MSGTTRQWRRLVRHFTAGLTDNDLISPGRDLHVPIAGILAGIIVGTTGAALMLLAKYNSVEMMLLGSFGKKGILTLAEKITLALDDKALVLGLVMIVMALSAVIFWDSLALDDRDRAVLGPLPVRPATVLLAKATSVATAALVAVVVLTVPPALCLPTVVLAKAPVGGGTVLRWMLAYGLASATGCIFVFLAATAVRTLLGTLLPRRSGLTVQGVLQFGLVLILFVLLLSWPSLAGRTKDAVAAGSPWLFWLPPMWFLGLEEVLIGRDRPVFAALARTAVAAFALVSAMAGLGHVLTLLLRTQRAAAQTGSPTSLVGRTVTAFVERVARWVAEDGRARASFLFTARTLTRNPRHRLYLAVSVGLGLAVSCVTLVFAAGGWGARSATIGFSAAALAAEHNLIFFLIVGIRMAASVPADLDAGWVFRFLVTPARERHLAGTRAAIFFLLVLPLLVCLAPVHAWLWGFYPALVHFAFGVVAALVLLEVAFAGYTKLPFVSAFAPGQTVMGPTLPLWGLGYMVFTWLTPATAWLFAERIGMVYVWSMLLVFVLVRLVATQSSRVRRDAMPIFEEVESDVQLLGVADAVPTASVSDDLAGGVSVPTDPLGALGSGRLFGPQDRRSIWTRVGRWVADLRPGCVGTAVRHGALTAGSLSRELVFAVRRLRANPGFTVFSVSTLALGIGVTTAIHSVIYSTLLRPLDVPAIDRLVNIYPTDPRSGGMRSVVSLSRPDFDDLGAMQTVFSDVAAMATFFQVAVVGRVGERVRGETVSGRCFPMLGIHPVLGRLLQPADDRSGAPLVTVIAHRMWRHRFEARPDVLGRTIRMAGEDFVVVGVAPPTFHGIETPNLAPADLWVPLSAARVVGIGHDADDRESRWLQVRGRLAQGRTLQQAAAEVAVLAARLNASHPIGRDLPWWLRGPGSDWRQWRVVPTRDVLIAPRHDDLLRSLARHAMMAVALVLLVACTNLANLTLARGTARRREQALRLALGASRWRLVSEHLIESALVVAAGGATALGVIRLVGVYGQSAVLRSGPWLRLDLAPQFDGRVVVVAAVATLLALVTFGVGPAWLLTRVDPQGVLGGGSTTGGNPTWRGRRTLVAAQVTISVALLAIASLGLRYMVQAARHDTGLALDRLAIVGFDFTAQGWTESRARHTLARLEEGARRLPAMTSVALLSALPIGSRQQTTKLATDERPFSRDNKHLSSLVIATPSTFDTLGLQVTAGRAFDGRDTATSTPVVVLSALAARDLFGTDQVVGREVLRQSAVVGQTGPKVVRMTIVGVTADTDSQEAGKRAWGVVYLPFAQCYSPRMMLVARTSRDAASAVSALQVHVSRLEPELAVFDAGTGLRLSGVESLAIEILVTLTGVLGLAALSLALVGLYGVLSFVVAARTHELGVRAALGASASRLMRMVIAEGLLPVLVGVVAGLAIGDLLEASLRANLVQFLPPLDALMVVLIPLPFLIAACLACYLPARRAARVDPQEALRHL